MKKNHVSCVQFLLEAEADVNIKDTDNDTILIRAAGRNKSTGCVRLLLKAGAKINMNCTALRRNIICQKIPNKDLCMLLYAAGETIDGTTIKGKTWRGSMKIISVPDYLLHEDLKLNLQHQCRETIRKHLLAIDRHENLFGRIPQLGLPSSLGKYLLYNMSLNADDDNDDDDDDEDDDDDDDDDKYVPDLDDDIAWFAECISHIVHVVIIIIVVLFFFDLQLLLLLHR